MTKKTIQTPVWTKRYPYLLVIGGAVGVFAAFTLTLEKLRLLENPTHSLSCDINPIMSCGSVMLSDQAVVSGFPNPWLGLIAFSMVLTVGMALLAKARFAQWFWRLFLLGSFLGVTFVHWLFYQSVYDIGKLCLYCMLVWIVAIPIFWYTLLLSINQGHVTVPRALRPAAAFAQKHHFDILATWFLGLIVLIVHHFWYYFSTL